MGPLRNLGSPSSYRALVHGYRVTVRYTVQGTYGRPAPSSNSVPTLYNILDNWVATRDHALKRALSAGYSAEA
jgi:hypothetical protein